MVLCLVFLKSPFTLTLSSQLVVVPNNFFYSAAFWLEHSLVSPHHFETFLFLSLPTIISVTSFILIFDIMFILTYLKMSVLKKPIFGLLFKSGNFHFRHDGVTDEGMFGRHGVEKRFLGLRSSVHLKLGLEWHEKPYFLSGLKDVKCFGETSSVEE